MLEPCRTILRYAACVALFTLATACLNRSDQTESRNTSTGSTSSSTSAGNSSTNTTGGASNTTAATTSGGTTAGSTSSGSGANGATALRLSTPTTQVYAGENIALTITAVDASNTAVPTYTGTVSVVFPSLLQQRPILFTSADAGSSTITGSAIYTGNHNITATDANGLTGTLSITVLAVPTVTAAYSNASDWTYYLVNDGGITSSSNTACSGTEPGLYGVGCLHGGELRHVLVNARQTCGTLQAVDNLGALTWQCAQGSFGAFMYSTGLSPTAQLSTLLDFNNIAWRSMSVTVSDQSGTVFTTTPSIWWSNPVQSFAGGAVVRALPVGITVMSSTATQGSFTSTNSHSALVVPPGQIINAAASTTQLSASAMSFLWVEGAFNAATGGADGIAVQNANTVVLNHVSVTGANGNNILFNRVNHSLAAHLTATAAGFQNILVANCVANSFVAVHADAAAHYNILVNANSTGNFINGAVVTRGNEEGLYVANANYNTFAHVTAADNNNTGVTIDTNIGSTFNDIFLMANGQANFYTTDAVDSIVTNVTTAMAGLYEGVGMGSSKNVVLQNILSINNQNGFGLTGVNASTFVNVVGAYNTDSAINLVSGSGNRFRGLLIAGNNAQDCSAPTSAGSGLHTVTGQGACLPDSGFSDPNIVTNANVVSSFAGAVSTTDSLNASNVNGSEAFASITDWFNFQSTYRQWGRGSAPLALASKGPCKGGTCNIYDWRLSAADTTLRGIVQTGAANPNNLVTHTFSTGATTTFLLGATEVMGDGLGNENSLCETGETCLQSANPGAYQGDGNTVSTPAPSGFTFVHFPTNGI